VRELRYAASAAVPSPGAAVLPAPDEIQVAVPPRAGQLAAVVQRSVGSDAAVVRQCGAPAVAPSPVAAAWPVDGMPVRRDAPWLAAPLDGPSQVVLPVVQPLPVVHPFHGGPGRTRRRPPQASRRQPKTPKGTRPAEA
jgi:hypothetical protein